MAAPVQLPINVVALTSDVQTTVKIGDVVHVVGEVVRIFAEQYTVMVHTRGSGGELLTVDDDQIVAVEVPEPPAEPDNGTWVIAIHDARHDGLNAFARDDDGAPDEPGRRWPRRWRNVGSGEFVDWPTVITRGGDPANQLVPAGGRPSARDLAISDAVIDVLKQHRAGIDVGTIHRKVQLTVPGATGGQVLQVLRRLETAHVAAHILDPQPEGLWVYRRHDPVQPTPGQQPLPTA